ncbi:MAG: hypothetical protein IJ001_03080 [Oscillospiraceae bacterium]|nr:hypothetical protein [Oscillospiraceae bacterium]
MKKLVSLLMIMIVFCSIPCTVFASETTQLTEDELIKQVLNNTATVTHEVRPLDSYTQEEIAQSPDLQYILSELAEIEPYSINNKSTYGDIYTTTVTTDSGQTVIYRSYPKVTFNVVDVGKAGSADIYSTFKVIEAVNVDGDLNEDWHNAIRYKNVTGAMGCGINTAFTDDITLSGNSSGLLAGDIRGIIDLIINMTGYTSASQILAVFDTITYTGSQVSNRNITDQYVRAVGAKMDDEELYDSEHNLTIQSSMSTIDSTQTANQQAKAVAEWTFDVYYFVGSIAPAHSDESISIDVDYVVNAQ